MAKIVGSSPIKEILYQIRQQDNVIKMAEATYCFMVFCYFGLNFLLEFGFQVPAATVSFLSCPLLCYKIVMTQYDRREIGIGACLFAVAGISLCLRRDTTILTNVLVIFSLKNVDIEKLLRPMFWCALTGSALVILCSLMGIGLPIALVKQYRPYRGVETRYCFGYGHPNQFHMYMVRLMCLFSIAFYEKLNWKHMVGLTCFNILVFVFSDSKSGVLCGLALVALLAIYRHGMHWVHTRAWRRIMMLAEVTVIVFAFASVILWGKLEILNLINRILTERVRLSYEALAGIGISLWGTVIGEEYLCDNGMVSMLLSYGLIPSIIYWRCTMCLYGKALKGKKDHIVILLLVVTIYAFMESNVLYKVFRNVPMMYMAWLIFPEKKNTRI